MTRLTVLFILLNLVAHGAARDPFADGLGGDPVPEVGKLVGSDVVPGMTIPKGAQARIVADHAGEKVTSPTALTFDEQGALYLTETHRFRFGVDDNRSRLYWLLDDIASETVEDRAAMYEKWREKAPLKAMTERSEVVRRFSDQQADGRFLKAEVFADAFNDQLDGTAAGVFAYEGTVFFANIPNIFGLRDNDGDGKAEVREVIEEGFGVRVSFSGHDLNGFVLGPDGRIYGTIGDRGFNVKTKEGKHYAFPDQGAIFRFEPDGTSFEVIHTGLRNPKEIAFDAYGNPFTVDNNSDQKDKARLVYIVDGGDSGWRMESQTIHSFHRQIGLDESPPNPWMAERMWEPKNDEQPGWVLPPIANITSGPSGLTYHPGVGFLESEVGRFLICDYRGAAARSAIWSFKVAPKGAGMELVDARTLVGGVAATDVEYAWDGKLFITDFIKGWTSHDDGRVLEVSAGTPFRAKEAEEAARLISEGFDQRSVDELESLLGHGDMRVRTRAQLALTRQLDGFPVLERVAQKGDGFAQLHAIWGLGIVARRGSATLPKKSPDDFVDLPNTKFRAKAFKALEPLLDHGDPEVRAQTVRVIGDSGIEGHRVNFGALLQDSSPRVRMFAAIAVGKTKAIGLLSYIWTMLDVNDDHDPYLRHAGVFAMESMCQPMQLVALRRHPSSAVRLAAAITLGRMGHEKVGDFVMDTDPRVSDEAIRLIHDRSIESVRPLVAALVSAEVDRERSMMMWRRIIHSAFRIGGEENLERVFGFALDEGKPLAARAEALRLLSIWSDPPAVDQSLGRFAPLPKRDVEPIRALLQSKTSELMALDPELIERALKLIDSYELDLTAVTDSDLSGLVLSETHPVGARKAALQLLMKKDPDDLENLLLSIVRGKGDPLAMDGLAILVERKSDQAAAGLNAAFDSEDISIRQRAWEISKGIKDRSLVERFVSSLARLKDVDGMAPDALELLTAAELREEVEVKEALKEYQGHLKASDDPLAEWNSALLGGDPKEGEKLFVGHPAAQCSRCHAAGHGQAGPSLDSVSKRGDRRFLLESLVIPAAKVTSGYGMVAGTLKDGSSVGGVLVEEKEDRIVLDLAGERRTILRDEIEQMSEPISSMPPMGAILSLSEMRDLVAWLSTQ